MTSPDLQDCANRHVYRFLTVIEHPEALKANDGYPGELDAGRGSWISGVHSFKRIVVAVIVGLLIPGDFPPLIGQLVEREPSGITHLNPWLLLT
jgi:hypothetical protein